MTPKKRLSRHGFHQLLAVSLRSTLRSLQRMATGIATRKIGSLHGQLIAMGLLLLCDLFVLTNLMEAQTSVATELSVVSGAA